jgi:hypothetical protein
MRRKLVIIAIVVGLVVAVYWLRQSPAVREKNPAPVEQIVSIPAAQANLEHSPSVLATNALGDRMIDARDPEFVKRVFPKFREFAATLGRLGVSPFAGEIQPESCSKIRIIRTPHGIICPFVIGDGWTAYYTRSGSFEGITRFGQRGPDNPFRAISRADMETLRRLSEGAITMPADAAWPIANHIAEAFGIDPANFERPQMHEEGLFDYRLGLQTVRYRAKGSDPLNQMSYTRDFTLKATTATTAVLVSYSNLDPR